LAIVLRHKLAAPIARATDWTHSYAAKRTMPQSAKLGLHPVIHVPIQLAVWRRIRKVRRSRPAF